ncbi:MAG: glutathione S-transferase N-terminal domain-containing protein, partial [Hyphomicrobiales bacterium]|nr:glutathione S-transferase N-terminal domain-containing protein [Hyphomicrobiales bacterium]
MSDLILHHYPPSPVTEKIRTGFGLKGLQWRSCEQNRLPDRPELFAMTGGYRRIPVLQIGADIYCDTQCMFHALEAVKPEPSFFPGDSDGMPFAVSRWTDREL